MASYAFRLAAVSIVATTSATTAAAGVGTGTVASTTTTAPQPTFRLAAVMVTAKESATLSATGAGTGAVTANAPTGYGFRLAAVTVTAKESATLTATGAGSGSLAATSTAATAHAFRLAEVSVRAKSNTAPGQPAFRLAEVSVRAKSNTPARPTFRLAEVSVRAKSNTPARLAFRLAEVTVRAKSTATSTGPTMPIAGMIFWFAVWRNNWGDSQPLKFAAWVKSMGYTHVVFDVGGSVDNWNAGTSNMAATTLADSVIVAHQQAAAAAGLRVIVKFHLTTADGSNQIWIAPGIYSYDPANAAAGFTGRWDKNGVNVPKNTITCAGWDVSAVPTDGTARVITPAPGHYSEIGGWKTDPYARGADPTWVHVVGRSGQSLTLDANPASTNNANGQALVIVPALTQAFFAKLQAWQDHVLGLIDPAALDHVFLTTETDVLTQWFEPEWRALVAHHRSILGNDVGLWHDSNDGLKRQDMVPHADVLTGVATSAYVSSGASNTANTDYTTQLAAWRSAITGMVGWAQALGKPFVWAETGATSTTGGAYSPASSRSGTATVDDADQASYFRAMITASREHPEFGGFLWWAGFQPNVNPDGSGAYTSAQANDQRTYAPKAATVRAMQAALATSAPTGQYAFRLAEVNVYAVDQALYWDGTKWVTALPPVTDTITSTGVGSATVSGTRTVTGTITAAGVGSATVSGTRQVIDTITATGVGAVDLTAYSVPVGAVGDEILAFGVGSAAVTFGSTVTDTVTATGVGSATVSGTRTVTDAITATGIGSATVSGTRTVTDSITATGIGSADVTADPAAVSYTLTATGVGSATVDAIVTTPSGPPAGGGGQVFAALTAHLYPRIEPGQWAAPPAIDIRSSVGEREYIEVEITDLEGADLTGVQIALSLGSYRDPGLTWATPAIDRQVDLSTRRLRVLTGRNGELDPVPGVHWLWARVGDSSPDSTSQLIVLRCPDDRITVA